MSVAPYFSFPAFLNGQSHSHDINHFGYFQLDPKITKSFLMKITKRIHFCVRQVDQ